MARFFWTWLGATENNEKNEWMWTVQGVGIPVSETKTYWEYGEPESGG